MSLLKQQAEAMITPGPTGYTGPGGTNGPTGATGYTGPVIESIVKMASATGIAGNTLASTNLTFESGIALSTHIPVFAIIKYRSGTMGIAVVELDANSIAISVGLALSLLTTSFWGLLNLLSGVVSNSGNLAIKVTTASIVASQFDVIVYGIKYQ